jgi:hypothetical protein
VRSELLKYAGANHEELIKEAFVGALARLIGPLLGRVGKVIVKNPLKSLGAGFVANDVAASAKRISDTASGGTNLMRSQARFIPPPNL